MTSAPGDSPKTPNLPLQGILWMIVSTMMFVSVTGIVRYLGSGLPAAESAFIRYAMGFLILLPVFIRMAKNMPSKRSWLSWSRCPKQSDVKRPGLHEYVIPWWPPIKQAHSKRPGSNRQ